MKHDAVQNSDTKLDKDQIKNALDAVLTSKEFSGADRLKEFLQYVESEDLAGRSNLTRAKTIAMDIYHRGSGETDAENLVRVDAGRLRRRLDVYYAGSGNQVPIRIHIDRGGYVPRYELRTEIMTGPHLEGPKENSEQSTQALNWRDAPLSMQLVVVVSLISLLVSGGLFLRTYQLQQTQAAVSDLTSESEEDRANMLIRREILFNEAPERLQALNLVEQGLYMLLPAPDPVRTEAGLILFQRAAALDPSYAGAPAASALASGIRTALTPAGENRVASLAMTKSHSDAGLELDATDPLSLTARALYDFLMNDYPSAKARLDRALKVDPGNPHVRDYYALIALFAGDFDMVFAVSGSADAQSADPHRRGASQNALGVALYLSGDPGAAVNVFERAAALGDPISVINHAVLAAAYQADGQLQKARNTKERMQRAWPGANLRPLLNQLFFDPAHVDEIFRNFDQIS